MGFLLLLIALIPGPKPSEQAMADFSRMLTAAGHEVAVVDRTGVVREGRLAAATIDSLTMAFAAGEQVLARDEIVSVDRLRDGNRDGLIKGAIFGALLGLYVMEAIGSDADAGIWLRVVGTYGAIGWALDAVNKNRQPVYRAPAPAKGAAVKLALRF